MPVRLGLLGGFRVTIEAEEVPLPMNAQRLVGFLAIHNQPLLRTFVGGSLWGDSDDDKAGGSLRSALWRLRRATYPMVSLTSDHIELSPVVAVDLHEGEALAQRVLDPTQDLDEVEEVNEDVLSADLLPDWTKDWVLLERESGEPLRESARLALIEAHLAENNVDAALRAYESFRKLLEEEVGLQPSQEMRAVVGELGQGET